LQSRLLGKPGISQGPEREEGESATPTEIRRELPPTLTAGVLAREALDGWLSAQVGEETARAVRLAATELISNAVRHGGLDPEDRIVLSGTVAEVVRIEIEQPSPVTGARVQPSDDPADHGMGLRIVDNIAKRWGSDEGPPGVVWFEIDT
jgi:anti-sigma regulatory factor (Ser/Thr protein kinase)